jgi:hypothetical protein
MSGWEITEKACQAERINIMWQKKHKGMHKGFKNHRSFIIVGLCLGIVFLAGCGASTLSNNSTAGAPMHAPADMQKVSQGAAASGVQTSGNLGKTTGLPSNATQNGPQYLVKSLQVTMEVKDSRQTAGDLQQWMSSSDPQATSDGLDYEQNSDSQYTVTLTYLVDIDHYSQVEQHLRDYAGQDGRTLISLQETVQDVTSDYVDTDARLTNLRTEQQRLLTFLSQAQNMSDTLSIESQLTQVEGQINDIQAHLDTLKGQTTYYTVTITLQPVGTAPGTPGPWNVIPVWQGAWNAVIAVWQGLATVLVWLVAFSVYLIPGVLLIWLFRKRPWRRTPAVAAIPLSSKPTESEPK